MANTYSCIYFHFVFAVKYRDAVITPDIASEFYRYLAGTIKSIGQVPEYVGGHADHVHMLISAKTTIDIPDFVKDVKLAGNNWIQSRVKYKFAWQEGYGVFSVSPTHKKAVANYIENQEEHHKKITFREEYKRLLEANGIDYDEQYLFKDLISYTDTYKN